MYNCRNYISKFFSDVFSQNYFSLPFQRKVNSIFSFFPIPTISYQHFFLSHTYKNWTPYVHLHDMLYKTKMNLNWEALLRKLIYPFMWNNSSIILLRSCQQLKSGVPTFASKPNEKVFPNLFLSVYVFILV